MKPLEGPYFPMEEALDKLNISETEFLHHIQHDRIQAVIFTKELEFLLFQRDNEDWIGRATCKYRGHLAIDKTHICKLIDEGEATLGKSWGRLLERTGITEWSSEYPFEKPTPNVPIAKWQPCSEPNLELDATPLPYERVPFAVGLGKVLGTFQRFSDSNPTNNSQATEPSSYQTDTVPDMELSFTSNSTFLFSALRIPISEIHKFLKPKIEKTFEEKVMARIKENGGRRENEFDTLIARILLSDTELQAKQVWRILEKEHPLGFGDREYDTDHILTGIDTVTVNWQSRHRSTITIKFASFPNVVSRMKKRLKKIMVEEPS